MIKKFKRKSNHPSKKGFSITNKNTIENTLEQLSLKKLFKYTIELHSRGNTIEAEKNYKLLIEKGFNNPLIFLNYGVILQTTNRNVDAISIYKKSITKFPEFPNTYFNLGNIYKELSKFKEAELFTRKAIKLNPKYEIAYLNLGTILIKSNRFDEAEKYLQKVIKLNPENSRAYDNLGIILMRDLTKLEEAEISIKKSIKLNPNNPISFCNLGAVLRKSLRLKEAELFTRKSIDLNPNYALAYSNLGTILRDLDRPSEAVVYAQRAIELDPDYPLGYSNYAGILNDLGDMNEAKRYGEIAIKLDPSITKAYYTLSSLYLNDKHTKFEDYLFQDQILKNKNMIQRMDIYFARANILDKKLNFSEYSKTLKIANNLNNKIFGSDYKQIKDDIKNYFEISKKLEINSLSSNNKITNIFIVGLPRAGKTITEAILAKNNQLLKCGEDSSLIDSIDFCLKTKKSDLAEIYLSNFSKDLGDKLFTCSTKPTHFIYTGIIASKIKKSKIIFCYRNPLDHVKELYGKYMENRYTFSTSITDSANLILSTYALMKEYKNLFPNKIFFLNYDDLVFNTEEEINSILSWLGWDYDKIFLNPNLDATTNRISNKINQNYLNIWKNYQEILQPAIEIFKNNSIYTDLISSSHYLSNH